MSGASARDLSLIAEVAEPQPQKRGWAVPFTVALLLGAGFAFWQLRGKEEVAPPTAAKPLPTEAAKPAEAAPQTATIRIKVDPPEAEVFLDDQKLPSNPTSKVLPIDGKVYKLRASAPGYIETVSEFSPMRDESGRAGAPKMPSDQGALVRSAQDPGARCAGCRQRRPPRLRRPASSPTKPSKPASCAQPFYVDSDGIKKVRPECL